MVSFHYCPSPIYSSPNLSALILCISNLSNFSNLFENIFIYSFLKFFRSTSHKVKLLCSQLMLLSFCFKSEQNQAIHPISLESDRSRLQQHTFFHSIFVQRPTYHPSLHIKCLFYLIGILILNSPDSFSSPALEDH